VTTETLLQDVRQDPSLQRNEPSGHVITEGQVKIFSEQPPFGHLTWLVGQDAAGVDEVDDEVTHISSEIAQDESGQTTGAVNGHEIAVEQSDSELRQSPVEHLYGNAFGQVEATGHLEILSTQEPDEQRMFADGGHEVDTGH
jgi:hypothetical protein